MLLRHHPRISRNVRHGMQDAPNRYSEVIKSTMASLTTTVSIVNSTVDSGADKKHQAPRQWPLSGEFTGDRWIPRPKGQ